MSGVCAGCMSRERLRCLSEATSVEGETCPYADMFIMCFNLHIVERPEDAREHFVCERCATRLTEACEFRAQVQRTQALLLQARVIKKEEVDAYEESVYPFQEDQTMEGQLEEPDPSTQDDPKKMQQKLKRIRRKMRKLKKKEEKRKAKAEKKAQKRKSYTETTEKRPYEPRNLPKDIPMDKKTLTCQICNQTFDTLQAVHGHMTTHFPRHLCHACGKVFLKKEQLKRHTDTHQKAECATCGMLLNKSSLKKHIRKYHTAIKPKYQCTECKEKFTQIRQKKEHMLSAHGMNVDIRCDICKINFAWKRSLTTHIRRVHKKEIRATCFECGKGFFDASGLSQHMLTHSGERKCECEICNKKFQTMNCVKTHMRYHTDAREFVCQICSVDFKYGSSLAKHMKKKHRGEHSCV